MVLTNTGFTRLYNQQIADSRFISAQELVAWMGAMQAQDYNMMKWAVGVRVPGSTEQMIEDAIGKGEVVRTHLLRPTWHLVSANDIYWMLELTAPHIKQMLRIRLRQLELSETIVNKSKLVIEKSLADGNHLTREELILKLENAGIVTNSSQISHLMMACELDSLVCSGAPKGKKQTYALLEERVPKTLKLSREEGLDKLARRYFTSHGPATVQDFTWWSGLPAKDVRKAVEMIKPDFYFTEPDPPNTLISAKQPIPGTIQDAAFLLPAYDEYIISYRDRSASLVLEHHKKTISDNGLFRPIVIVNGKVAGIWKPVRKKDKTVVEIEYFQAINRTARNLIENASARYGRFIIQDIEIVNREK